MEVIMSVNTRSVGQQDYSETNIKQQVIEMIRVVTAENGAEMIKLLREIAKRLELQRPDPTEWR
jgi:hypothetical protein